MKQRTLVRGGLAALGLVLVLGTYWLVESHRGTPSSEASAGTLISVQVGALKRMTLHRYVTGYGTTGAAPATTGDPAASAKVAAPVSGVVTRVDVAQGQRVKRGQRLVELNSNTMTEAYAEREAARQKKLYAQHNTSLKALQNAEAQLALLRVTAPLSGTLVSVNVRAGTAVNQNTVLMKIVDLRRLVVTSDIPASQAPELRRGQSVQVLNPSLTTRLFYISPTVDTNDGSVMAWAALPEHSGLRPGEFVRLRIIVGVHKNALAAPEKSVITDTAGHSVISVVRGNEAIRTPVKTGYREGGWVQVSAPGLKPGDKVVTVGAFGLPKRTKIQVMSTSGGPTASANSGDPRAQ